MTTKKIVIHMILAMITSVFFNGFAVSTLWGWYIAPVFNVQQITIIQGFGICLIVMLLAIPFRSDDRTKEEVVKDSWSNAVAIPVISLIIGFIVKFFM